MFARGIIKFHWFIRGKWVEAHTNWDITLSMSELDAGFNLYEKENN